jgi:hypothetical protein
MNEETGVLVIHPSTLLSFFLPSFLPAFLPYIQPAAKKASPSFSSSLIPSSFFPNPLQHQDCAEETYRPLNLRLRGMTLAQECAISSLRRMSHRSLIWNWWQPAGVVMSSDYHMTFSVRGGADAASKG